jgi:hypothetical protein
LAVQETEERVARYYGHSQVPVVPVLEDIKHEWGDLVRSASEIEPRVDRLRALDGPARRHESLDIALSQVDSGVTQDVSKPARDGGLGPAPTAESPGNWGRVAPGGYKCNFCHIFARAEGVWVDG